MFDLYSYIFWCCCCYCFPSLGVFIAVCCVRACETLVGCVSCDVSKELVTMTVMGKWWHGLWIKLVSVWVWCLVCGCGGSNRITCLSPSYLPFPSILSILTLLVYSKLHNPLCVGLWWPYSGAKTVHFTQTYTRASVSPSRLTQP